MTLWRAMTGAEREDHFSAPRTSQHTVADGFFLSSCFFKDVLMRSLSSALRTTMGLFATLAATVIAAGCAADGTAPEDNVDGAGEELGSSISVPNPSGAYFASIVANGSGCPQGSWDAEISPDGKQLSVTFHAYSTVIDEGQSISLKDCMLAVDLKTPSGISFAVKRFRWEGHAELDSPGMSASFRPKYYFQGNPVPAKEYRSSMQGPMDDAVQFDEPIVDADLVWSPCGNARRLNVQSRLVLQNNPTRTGKGAVNIDAMALKLRWDIAWRTC
jgi:hypothetical protein